MIIATALTIGFAVGLLLGTATMGAGIAVDRQNCRNRAAEQHIEPDIAEKVCASRRTRRVVKSDPDAWDIAARRAERRLRRHGRI